MTQEKNYKRINMRVGLDIYNYFEELSKKMGQSMTACVAFALLNYMQENKALETLNKTADIMDNDTMKQFVESMSLMAKSQARIANKNK